MIAAVSHLPDGVDGRVGVEVAAAGGDALRVSAAMSCEKA